MTNCERYLGLPMVGGKSKTSIFRQVQERVTKRVMRWKEKKYLKGRKRGVNQDSSTSDPNLLHEHVQNTEEDL